MMSRSAEGRRGLGRALALLFLSCGLSACVAQGGAPGYGRPASTSAEAIPRPAGRGVVALLPLTGSNAPLGQSLLLGARLAFQPGQADQLDSRDTKGTPQGAAAAASAAIAAGAGIIIGPLTAVETSAVAPLARAQGVPVLALTSDTTKAQPGVWTLGLTPGQQVRTLVRASVLDNKRRIGAILPANPFGDALATGLAEAAAESGLPQPSVLRYQGPSGLDGAIAQMGASGPVDALLLGTPGDVTLRVLPALITAGLGPDRVRLLGTALWGRDAAKLAPLAGAWFAGPPADTLKVFEDRYIARYGGPPREYASLAFDAAAAAKAAVGPGGIDVSVLVNPSGFAGANGVFRLQPDGAVRRSLALFEIGAAGARRRETPPEPMSPGM